MTSSIPLFGSQTNFQFVDSFLKGPVFHRDQFASPSQFLQSQTLQLTKTLYDHAKIEGKKGLGRYAEFPELIVDGLDTEQVWAEIEPDNDDLLEYLDGLVSELVQDRSAVINLESELSSVLNKSSTKSNTKNASKRGSGGSSDSQISDDSMDYDYDDDFQDGDLDDLLSDEEQEEFDSQDDEFDGSDDEMDRMAQEMRSKSRSGRDDKPKPRPKRTSVLDDDFFNLDEMNKFADEGETGGGLMTTAGESDDDEIHAAMYSGNFEDDMDDESLDEDELREFLGIPSDPESLSTKSKNNNSKSKKNIENDEQLEQNNEDQDEEDQNDEEFEEDDEEFDEDDEEDEEDEEGEFKGFGTSDPSQLDELDRKLLASYKSQRQKILKDAGESDEEDSHQSEEEEADLSKSARRQQNQDFERMFEEEEEDEEEEDEDNLDDEEFAESDDAMQISGDENLDEDGDDIDADSEISESKLDERMRSLYVGEAEEDGETGNKADYEETGRLSSLRREMLAQDELLRKMEEEMLQEDALDELNRDKSEKNVRMSRFEQAQHQLQKRTEQYEKELLAKKKWALQGEIRAFQRGKDSLLDTDLEFEITSRAAPLITADFTKSLEDMIKRRIADNVFDDVIRKVEKADKGDFRMRASELDQSKSAKSLAQIYEDEYLQSVHGVQDVDSLTQAHKECIALFKSICRRLDALSNAHYAPLRVKDEVEVTPHKDAAAVQMEEVTPTVTSAAQLLAPEEVYVPSRAGPLKGESERTSSEKKAIRRAHKAADSKSKAQSEAERRRKSMLEDPTGTASSSAPSVAAALKTIQKAGSGVTISSNSDQTKYASSTQIFQHLTDAQQQKGKQPTSKSKSTSSKSTQMKLS